MIGFHVACARARDSVHHSTYCMLSFSEVSMPASPSSQSPCVLELQAMLEDGAVHTRRIARFPSLEGPNAFSFDWVCQALSSSAAVFDPVKMDWLLSEMMRHYIGLCKPCDFSCRSSCRFGYEFLRMHFARCRTMP